MTHLLQASSYESLLSMQSVHAMFKQYWDGNISFYVEYMGWIVNNASHELMRIIWDKLHMFADEVRH